MVFFSLRFLTRNDRLYSKTFIDRIRIYVAGGSGGNGLPSLGGVGGRGGHVYIVGSQNENFSLMDFKHKHSTKRFIADSGSNSTRRTLSALKGASIFVQVPMGISVLDGSDKSVVGEILTKTDKVLIARGGAGGSRSTNFRPEKGQRRCLFLDLKTIADVGFVGFPNAGKSTLLTKLSNARPEIAEYPFTTLKPELGVMEFPDFRQIRLADLPGLIEGAFLNKGRGHTFLKHIERTRVLLFVVDINGFQLSAKDHYRDAFETVQLLTKELEIYDHTLVKRPAILAINKMDVENSHLLLNEFNRKMKNWKDHVHTLPSGMVPEKQINFHQILPISAIKGESTDQLKHLIRQQIDKFVVVDHEQLRLDFEKEGLSFIDNSKQKLLS